MQLAASLTGIVSQRLLPRIGGGRVAAFEVLVATYAVRNLIREGKTQPAPQHRHARAASTGCRPSRSASRELVADGIVDYEEAVTRSLFPDEITRARHLAQAGRT